MSDGVAFNAYKTFLALHRHFYSEYDYFKYNGSVNVKFENFLKRKDRFFFYKLGKKENVEGFVLSNIIASPKKIWVTDLLNDKAETIYKEWKKTKDSETYTLKNEISNLTQDDFRVVDGQHPSLLKKQINDEISFHTFCVLDVVINFSKAWNKKINDPVIWPDIYVRMQNYKPFLNVKTDKIKEIIIDKLT